MTTRQHRKLCVAVIVGLVTLCSVFLFFSGHYQAACVPTCSGLSGFRRLALENVLHIPV